MYIILACDVATDFFIEVYYFVKAKKILDIY